MSPECLPFGEQSEGLRRGSRQAVAAVTLPAVALALAAVLAASGAAAQNLLTNPAVVDTVAPWTGCPSNSILFDDRNEGCTDSGSAVAASAQVDCGIDWDASDNQVVIRQCVPLSGTGIVPGSTAVYSSGWVRVVRDEPTWLAVVFFGSDDCTDSEMDTVLRLINAPGLQWVPFELENAFTVPVGTASMEYRVFAVDEADNSTLVLCLDDAYLGPVPLLFAEGFEETEQVACRWSSHSP